MANVKMNGQNQTDPTIHYKSVPSKRQVNQALYLKVLERLRKRIRQKYQIFRRTSEFAI